MEEYILDGENASSNINLGKYYNSVHQKHVDTYGEYGAQNIRDNIIDTYKNAIIQLNSNKKNNNMLLVGKVQSGKTSNLELFTALAFDNGYNLVVIYGGYDNTLLNQTIDRFKNTFDVPNKVDYGNDKPVIFSSDELATLDDEIFEDLIDENKPIFIISMKRPSALGKVNDLFNKIDTKKIKCFVIDDEGDQASLNTKKNKKNDASATYSSIVKMKELLKDPLYLSVTATPQALVFLNEYSQLRPDSIRVITPGDGYCGADEYHLYDSEKIEIIDDEDQQKLSDGKMPKSLTDAIYHYILASAIMYKRGIKESDMIVHSHRNKVDHETTYDLLNARIGMLKDAVRYNDKEIRETLKKEFKNVYTIYFKSDIQQKYNFEELWTTLWEKIIKRISLILKNSAGQSTQTNEKLHKYRIYIGGDLLQRGITFDKLVTTYFSRWAKDGGNMDTNLQRARWFGYRNKYIDLCKIFTSSTIAREFTNLAEIETDLWEQFYAIQKGNLQIDDILIKAAETSQRPTRQNVADYKIVSFKSKWIKQRIGLFDTILVKENNKIIDDLISNNHFISTSVGRTDNKESAKYALISKGQLVNVIDHMKTIFNLEPFEQRPLRDLIESSDEIPVILMHKNEDGRERSFYSDNKIYALHQGADSKDPRKMKYQGDSSVIVNKDKINIQIHRIIPKKKDRNGNVTIESDFAQYMFAIYVPKEKSYFVRGEFMK